MKKYISCVLLFAAMVVAPSFFTSCSEDEPESPEQTTDSDNEVVDPFENLYGYWINSDYSGAMEIVKTDFGSQIKYFVYTVAEVKSTRSICRNISDYFTALNPSGQVQVRVQIITSSQDKLILQKDPYVASSLTSYAFTRVSEAAFYTYLEFGNSGNGNSGDEEANTLVGTWEGYDGTPGLASTDKYTLTFYSSGKATEVVAYDGGSMSMSGTYQYANGKITEWEMEDGSALMGTLGNCPWTVTFITSTEIKIGNGYSITFARK